MPKPVIIIASLLKPVDDTRMFEKFANSISQTNKYEVNIIGSYSNSAPQDANIIFHPVFQNTRFSFSRIFPSTKIWKLYIKLKPELIIANTHDLLIVSTLYKILFGCKLVYDIRENYSLNLLSQKIYPAIVAYPFAAWVRLKEIACKPFISKFILAEKLYYNELPYCQSKATILENKHVTDGNENGVQNSHQFLFSGTLSRSSGVFDAIDIVDLLHNLDSRISLVIIGYCPLAGDRTKLKRLASQNEHLSLIGIDGLVDHTRINEQIGQSAYGIISYQLNDSNRNCIPTKLYEYLGSDLLVLSIDNPLWNEMISKYQTGLFYDSNKLQSEQLLEDLSNLHVIEGCDKNDLLWASEEPKLLSLVAELT